MIGRPAGSICALRGAIAEGELPRARVGDGVRICARDAIVGARVAALHGSRVVLTPFGSLDGVASGDRVESDPAVLTSPLGAVLLGRAIDATGAPLDHMPPPRGARVAVTGNAHAVADRRPCDAICWTGVRAIDGPLAFGRGARIGIFGSPGAGKSSLLDAVVRGELPPLGLDEQKLIAAAGPEFFAAAAAAFGQSGSDLKLLANILKERTGRKGADLFMPLRVALTGQAHGPELAPLLRLMPAETALRRLKSHAQNP